MIHKNIEDNIYNWKAVTSRILSVSMKSCNNQKTIITAYGPNEDDTANNKEAFWTQLSEVTEEAKGDIYILGDFNSRVGKSEKENESIVGKYGEITRNNNGKRMIEFCRLNNLFITNTFFQHKDIHRFAREVKSRNEKSIIDYILVGKNNKKNVVDSRVFRKPEIGSDHFIVVAKIRMEKENTNHNEQNNTISNITYNNIRTYKLREADVAKKYTKLVENKLAQIKEEDDEIETIWKTLKIAMLQATEETCGKYRVTNNKPQTKWWSETIKISIKEKKEAWKRYLTNKNVNTYNKYKEKRIIVRDMIIEAKKQAWEEFGQKMENDSKTNQKLFYKVLKGCRKEQTYETKYILDKTGKVLKHDEEVIERWKEYFKDLLSIVVEVNAKNREQMNNTDLTTENISLGEIVESMHELKMGKAPGYDKITTEMMKNLGPEGNAKLLLLMNKIWTEEKIPEDWQISLIVPIHKKGDKKNCNNYRGITLICTAMKLLEKIINKRIMTQLDKTLDEAQSGFRKGRSTQDHIFAIKQVIERALKQDKNVYLGFVDLEKAFDKVPREKLWDILNNREIDNKIIRIIKTIYDKNNSAVVYKNLKSTTFRTENGLRQGGGLSPTLFIIYIDEIIKKSRNEMRKTLVGYRNLVPVKISEGIFADDLVIIASSENQLNANINLWNKNLRLYGMTINKTKSNVMVVGKEEKLNISIENVQIEQVDQYRYLGVELYKDGRINVEISKRIEKSLRVYYSLNKILISKKEISRKTKINIFKTIYRPILTYGCETWTLAAPEKSRLQAAEMKYLRRIIGVTRMDRMRNEEVRNQLEVESLHDYIEKKQLGWWGHLIRMNNTTQVKMIWEAKEMGKRKKGRPRLEWNKMIAEILKKKGLTITQAKISAQNRKEWKLLIEV